MRTLEDRFNQYKNAVDRLEEVIETYKNNNNNQIIVDAMIQRFEFCVELSWKFLKDYLKSENVGDFNSPRSIMKESYKMGLITEGELWLDMLEDRNLTSHTYDEIVANTIRDNILNTHYTLLKKLKEKMEEKIYEK